MTKYLLALFAVCSLSFATSPLTYEQFSDCITANVGSYDSDCVLDSNTYIVDGSSILPLQISRSNITVEGAWPYPTIQRAATYSGGALSLMNVAAGGVCPSASTVPAPCFVVIKNLVFDGNASGGAAYSYQEVDLGGCNYCQVVGVTFQNSANFSLNVNSNVPTAVEYSTFQNILYGAIYAGGGTACSNPVYWYPNVCLNITSSTFNNSGVGAVGPIVINGLLTYNVFNGNHSQCVYSAPGGQIDLDFGSDSVQVLYNTFENGPTCSNGYWATGMEIDGTNLTLTDNTITNNAGQGIGLDGAQNVSISTDNPSSYPISNNNQYSGSRSNFCGTGAGSFTGSGRFADIDINAFSSATNQRNTSNISVNNVWAVGGQTYNVLVHSCTPGRTPVPVTITNNCVAGYVYGGVYDPHNCGSGSNQACIASGSTVSNNQTSGCGGH